MMRLRAETRSAELRESATQATKSSPTVHADSAAAGLPPTYDFAYRDKQRKPTPLPCGI